MIQGSDEWKMARLGKVGASQIADLMAKTKTGWGASRSNLMAAKLAERLTGTLADSFTNAAMEWGTATEAEARNAYSFYASADVEQVGFVDHPVIAMTGASPDGLIGGAGLVEIKCPNTATHIDTLLYDKVPSKYILQMQWQMACTDRLWCDFVSYDPRMPEALRMWQRRVGRDTAKIEEISAAVVEFLAELDQKEAALRKLAGEGLAVAA